MKVKAAVAPALVCLATMMISSAGADDALKPKDLVGLYDIISAEKYGVEDPKENYEGSTARFTEDRIVVVDKEDNEVYGASYTLEAGDKGEHGGTVIKMVSKLAQNEGQISYGLIDKKDDRLRLIYALPGAMRPSDFKTKDKQLMFVMEKRAEKE